MLKYCINRALEPDPLIRQMSKITHMHFRQFNIRFIDSYCIFASSLRSLPSTFDSDTIRGFFPHFFNRPENQSYIGNIPSPSMFGDVNMSKVEYEK